MQWSFGPFRLDTASATLWHDAQRLPVRPKAFDVLVYLVSHAGELVRKETLLEVVWPEAAVGDAVLKVRIRELRQLLGEKARETTYIETVPRHGYRFCAPVTTVLPLQAGVRSAAPVPVGGVALSLSPPAFDPPSIMVGRETELAQLQQHFTCACQGHRQVVYITGDVGMGKTTLVDAFVAQVATTVSLWIGRGQCIEQYGAGEAYLPLLEALGRVGRQRDGARLVTVLRHQAPSWLVHLPALVTAEDTVALRQRGAGATQERMLRELAEAIETLTREQPLLLVLEDLHWSDASTVAWLTYVAWRRDPARLLVLGTYRPGEAVVHDHPVHAAVQELYRHGKSIRTIAAELGVNRGRVARALQALEHIPVATSPGMAGRSHTPGGRAEGPFVGRQHELGRLQALLADVSSERGRLAMLVGEPGIGKTRTAQELTTYAGQAGAQVLWGRCDEHPGAPPYWPWVQSIRAYVQTQSVDGLHADMGAGAADIAEIIPDVHTYLPGLPPAPKLDNPDHARFRLFMSIATLFKQASQRRPLVIVLDNLHWADTASLLLLEFLAPEIAAGSSPLNDTVGEFRKVSKSVLETDF